MRFIKAKHVIILFNILFIVFLQNCSIKKKVNSHGLSSLKNRFTQLEIGKTNSNDVLELFGNAHSKSLTDDNVWLYFERTTVKGQIHRLGKNILEENNIIKLKFTNLGILSNKVILNKDQMKKVKYSKAETEQVKGKKSIVNGMMNSIKEKMYRKR